jgi:hypothetical protein
VLAIAYSTCNMKDLANLNYVFKKQQYILLCASLAVLVYYGKYFKLVNMRMCMTLHKLVTCLVGFMSNSAILRTVVTGRRDY